MTNYSRYNIFANSAQASSVSQNGSRISLNLSNPINVFKKLLRVIQANITFSFPNVSTIIGNSTILFTYNAVDYQVDIPNGIYGIDDLNNELIQFFSDFSLPSDLFSFIGNNSTGTVTIYVQTSLLFSIDFTNPLNLLLQNTLGFSQNNISTAVDAYFRGDSVAQLNNITNIYVCCDLCGSGNNYSNEISSTPIIESVPITVSPGDLINYQPKNAVVNLCNTSSTSTITIYLVDQNFIALDMAGESFNLVLEIYDDK